MPHSLRPHLWQRCRRPAGAVIFVYQMRTHAFTEIAVQDPARDDAQFHLKALGQ